MKEFAKKIINGSLSPLGLRMIRVPKTHLSGQYLFEDLGMILGTDSPTCLDVGANEGQTIEALLSKFRTPTIHAFEPSRDMFFILNGKKYPSSVRLHHMAMGASAGRRDFRNYHDSRLSSFLPLSADADNPFRGGQLKSTEVAEVDTVDSFLVNSRITKLDLLKIDTQGFDFEVLKGAYASLQAGKIRCVQVELNFIEIYQGQAQPAEISTYLGQSNVFLVDLYEKVMQGHRLGWCTALFIHVPSSSGAVCAP